MMHWLFWRSTLSQVWCYFSDLQYKVTMVMVMAVVAIKEPVACVHITWARVLFAAWVVLADWTHNINWPSLLSSAINVQQPACIVGSHRPEIRTCMCIDKCTRVHLQIVTDIRNIEHDWSPSFQRPITTLALTVNGGSTDSVSGVAFSSLSSSSRPRIYSDFAWRHWDGCWRHTGTSE